MSRTQNTITILGTGTSTGVPVTGCHCHVCESTDERNKRLRTSVFLQTASNKSLLIDCSPDLRAQCLKHKIENIDGVIITHEHADHLHGIDDLRPYCFHDGGKTIPLFSSDETLKAIHHRFPYIFQHKERPMIGGGRPKLELHPVEIGKEFSILEETFLFYLLPHGVIQTACFIHQKLGYIVDCSSIPADVLASFKKAQLDILIIDCLRIKPHQTHLHLSASLEYAEKIGAKFTGLIHFSHHFDHEELSKKLDPFEGKILPLYDGQVLTYGGG